MAITISGPLSDAITKHLDKWQLVDDTSDKIDQLTLSFNASRIKELPPYGAKYDVKIHGAARGSFQIIGKSINDREVMTLKLSPVSKSTVTKQKQTQSYVEQTILFIVTDVVTPCGYVASVPAPLAQQKITCYRNNETAGEFLNRLANDYDAVTKPYNNIWVFNPRLTKTNSNGSDKPTLVIDSNMRVISLNLTESANEDFGGVKCGYWDDTAAKYVELTQGGEPYKDLGTVTQNKANELIKSHSSANNSTKQRVNAVLPTGDPVIAKAFAEGVLTLDRGRFFKGVYIIDSVTITETQTTIQASLPK